MPVKIWDGCKWTGSVDAAELPEGYGVVTFHAHYPTEWAEGLVKVNSHLQRHGAPTRRFHLPFARAGLALRDFAEWAARLAQAGRRHGRWVDRKRDGMWYRNQYTDDIASPDGQVRPRGPPAAGGPVCVRACACARV
jgi:hypothetical protein